MPAKRIIVLNRLDANRVTYVLWADVPAVRQFLYKQVGPEGRSAYANADAAEKLALLNGQVAERVGVASREPGGSLAQVRAELQLVWTAYQNEINSATGQWQFYGSVWDGATWTPGGI